MLDIAESPAPPTKGAAPSWSIPNAEEELEDGEDEKGGLVAVTPLVDLVVRVLVDVRVPLLCHGVNGYHDGLGGFGDIDDYVLLLWRWRWWLCGCWRWSGYWLG